MLDNVNSYMQDDFVVVYENSDNHAQIKQLLNGWIGQLIKVDVSSDRQDRAKELLYLITNEKIPLNDRLQHLYEFQLLLNPDKQAASIKFSCQPGSTDFAVKIVSVEPKKEFTLITSDYCEASFDTVNDITRSHCKTEPTKIDSNFKKDCLERSDSMVLFKNNEPLLSIDENSKESDREHFLTTMQDHLHPDIDLNRIKALLAQDILLLIPPTLDKSMNSPGGKQLKHQISILPNSVVMTVDFSYQVLGQPDQELRLQTCRAHSCYTQFNLKFEILVLDKECFCTKCFWEGDQKALQVSQKKSRTR